MKKLIILFLLLGFSAESFAQAAPSYIFFDGTYEQLQTRAENAKRPFFIYFYANWSMPCKEMNEKTFHNKYVIDYAQSRYLGMELDGESLITEGRKLADHFNIVYYPTVIIFSPYGKELKRLYGYVSPSDFLKELRKYENSMKKPEEGEQSEPEEVVTPKEGEYLFKMQVRKQAYKGYGIQVGVFGNYRNAFVRLLELENDHGQRNVLVHIKEDGEAPLFKLILGPFVDKERAKRYHDMIAKKGVNGIVISLERME